MGRTTDTEQIRIYLKNHMGGVLDFSYISNHVFSDVSVDNLRKYVSRISKEGILKKISKGIYLIGDSPLSDKERIIKFYVENYNGLRCGASLLKQYDIIEDEPEKIEIITTKTVGNKYIESLNIEINETKNDFESIGIISIMEAMELIHLRDKVTESEGLSLRIIVCNLLDKHYDDFVFEKCIREIRYKRYEYLLFADYLKLLNKSNKVMELYDKKMRLCVNKK